MHKHMMGGRRFLAVERLPRIADEWLTRVTAAIDRSQAFFLITQAPEGFWAGELQANVTLTAEYIMFRHFLGHVDPERERKAVHHILRTQQPDGGWNIYYGGPSNLSATIEAYFALKLAGCSPDTPSMHKARELIHAKGGVEKSRVFTKINLALFGQYDWQGIPTMPVEMMFLPTDFYFSIYEFSSWSRSVIVPLMIVFAQKPQVTIPGFPGIPELYNTPPHYRRMTVEWSEDMLSWRNFFVLMDRLLKILEKQPIQAVRVAAIRRAERWILEHQDDTGDWGGIMPAMMNSILALLSLGYEPSDPVIAKGLEAIERFGIETTEEFRLQSCVSPVWDTALAAIALYESGLSPTHPALLKAARWLLSKQVLRTGAWAIKNRKGEPGGWAFEFFNDFFPDNDDTAIVLLALLNSHLPEAEDMKNAYQRGLAWLLSMQCADGGWGAFDINNNKRLLNKIPFADLESLLDPSTGDVTGRIMELLGKLGYARKHPVVRRALRFLRRDQTEDGAWYGRWGVNYVYGTWAVLTGLRALGEDFSQEYIQRAVRWVESCQNPDGGWGESCFSYDDPRTKGMGESTPSQTAWAVMALIESGRADSSAVERGIRFLLERQRDDGTWEEEEYTGTGFPKHFYINYHLYRNYFPLMALARYRAAVAGDGQDRM
ncbi:MAG: squalene--hopene cyclase [Nitrospinae bacterium]|nr:squalene--hopene cyclase [Nitrospinota bacterium]